MIADLYYYGEWCDWNEMTVSGFSNWLENERKID
jgi:hypothetical protein